MFTIKVNRIGVSKHEGRSSHQHPAGMLACLFVHILKYQAGCHAENVAHPSQPPATLHQNAERLSKEAMNIVEQLYERDDHLIQEPEQKFTLNEMWEVAFHNLATLQAREAFVTVKGVMEHPEKIRTLDNPREPAIKYPFDERYMSLAELRESHARVREALESRIKNYTRSSLDAVQQDASVDDLDFLEPQ